ncbi:hypothetical protein IFM89_009909 [Coptis chinensis]|uniref:Protein kinase domain-containing protein n=1 Tax=Coptis chinensis TaxID=261450 RepID=A0A835LUC3_9MAGN|nr:hypothetical protein IFM89_009909 [Coptis chinensis]
MAKQFKVLDHFMLVISSVLVLLLCFPPSTALTIETEALLQFKKQLKDPFKSMESWNPNSEHSPCDFSGITCDPVSHLVTKIYLENESLSGEISPSISSLKSLSSLVLASNSISGSLPFQLIECSNLQVLNLTGNDLTGTIPDFSSLKNLQILDLSVNYFSGPVPTWVGNLTGLVSLGLGQNDYEEGEIPENIGKLKNLTWLFLAGSNLRGEIPESIFELESLETLDFSNNKLSGKLSKAIAKLKNLNKIELFVNNFTGELPKELAELNNLSEIDISKNQMYGKLPPEFGEMKNLAVFQLYENYFTGELPEGFGNLRYLKGFSVYRNNFSGTIPENFGRFSPLNSIDVSENKFSGAFPRFLCENRTLQYLLALDNNFSGELPDSYAECKSLQRFRVSKNHFSGKISSGVWGLPFAVVIDFGDNDFTGEVSSEIGLSISLTQLYVQNNQFSGQMPSELGKLTLLGKLSANNNSFSGEIPSEILSLEQLSSLHLEGNSLTGPIPSEVWKCTRLADLNLAQNFLSGDIPNSLSLLSNLNSLNLSQNRLSGIIPQNLQRLKLSSIDLSGNQLRGRIPSNLAMTGGDQAFSNNDGLCVDKNLRDHVNSRLTVCSGKHSHKSAFDNKLLLFGVICLSLIAIMACLLLVSYKNFKYSESHKQDDLEEDVEKDPYWKLEAFHQMELDADEICNLEDENLIGSGSTGKVYRLNLKKNVGTVAVKQLWKGKEVRLLTAEMEILGTLRHRNILKLYAFLMKGELAYSLKVTEKSDVYSFGVVLLELVTGRSPVEPEFGEEKDIVYWVSTHLGSRDDIIEVLDKRVSGTAVDDMIKVLRIATVCTTKLPSLRPNMRDVIKMLADADPCIIVTAEKNPNSY